MHTHIHASHRLDAAHACVSRWQLQLKVASAVVAAAAVLVVVAVARILVAAARVRQMSFWPNESMANKSGLAKREGGLWKKIHYV